MDTLDPKAIVRAGYDRASHEYRGDDYAYPRSGYEHWLRRLTSHLAPGARVLDLGCGNGIPVARELAGGCQVTGVDLSSVNIERARALVPGATFVCADMTQVAFAPGSFDAIAAFYSIINVPLAEQPALFTSMHQWLAPGGWMLAVVGRDPWTGVEQDWRDVPGLGMYYSHADAATYKRWIADAGFALVESGTEPRQGNPGYAVLIAQRGD